MKQVECPVGEDEKASSPAILPSCAHFPRRVVATLIDMAIFSGITALLLAPLLPTEANVASISTFDRLMSVLKSREWSSHASGSLGIWIALWWSYFVVGWGWAGATPGKWAVGLRVVDHRSRYPIGISRGLLRLVAYIVSSLSLGIGHLLILVRRDHRALHDVLSGTRVIKHRDAKLCGIRRDSRLSPDTNPD